MKWFKHETSDRNKVESKLIKAKFGIEGYGIYQSLLEIIGETIESDNFRDWGHVNAMHDVNSLAEECCVTSEKLKTFLIFCDEKHIFEKHKGRLFSRLILRRLDNWADRIHSEKSTKNNSVVTRKSLRSNSVATTDKEEKEKEKENRGEGEEKETSASATPAATSTDDFEMFFDAYPNKIKKGEARRIWIQKNIGKKTAAEILGFIDKAKQTDAWKRKMVPSPVKFLEDERWQDDLATYADYAPPDSTRNQDPLIL